MTSDITGFVPLHKNLILKLRGQAGYINSRNLVKNELYRIGGLSTVRGFDEENLYASVFGIGTTEIRFLFEENSALFIFYDQAQYKNFDKQIDDPLGFGAGIEFQTGAGIFTLTYAMGKQLNNPVEFRNARIHFGFVNRF
jgi:hemolysin activation/secretion protein